MMRTERAVRLEKKRNSTVKIDKKNGSFVGGRARRAMGCAEEATQIG